MIFQLQKHLGFKAANQLLERIKKHLNEKKEIWFSPGPSWRASLHIWISTLYHLPHPWRCFVATLTSLKSNIHVKLEFILHDQKSLRTFLITPNHCGQMFYPHQSESVQNQLNKINVFPPTPKFYPQFRVEPFLS